MSRVIGSPPFVEEVPNSQPEGQSKQYHSDQHVHGSHRVPRCFLMIRLMIFSGGQQYRPDT